MNQFQKEVNEVGQEKWDKIGVGKGLRQEVFDRRPDGVYGDYLISQVWDHSSVAAGTYIVSQEVVSTTKGDLIDVEVHSRVAVCGHNQTPEGRQPPIQVQLDCRSISEHYGELSARSVSLVYDERNNLRNVTGSVEFIKGNKRRIKIGTTLVEVPSTKDLLDKLRREEKVLEVTLNKK